MRDKQLATFLETWNGFATGMISSEKPFSCKGLSDVLELDVSEKYYLSPKACVGILRRAEKRGKELPEMLRLALMKNAMQP